MGALRLRRLRLRDFRGVEDREISFPETGVTIVVGPNEIGKSSLAEALDLVLDELDRANKQAIRDTKPVDRDVGPDVEVDLRVGPYDFTLRKRFLKRPETELTIRAPRPESLTGDAAHERVREILRTESDEALFRALRLTQGRPLEQASVKGSLSLAAALDRAAGGGDETGDEGSLLDRAHGEHARYFTPQGREQKTVFDDPRAAIAADRAEADRLARDLRVLEADVERTATLADELASARGTLGPLREALVAADRDVAAVAGLRTLAAERAADATRATAAADMARRAHDERGSLIAAQEAATAERTRLARVDAAETESLGRAEEGHATAQSDLVAARARRDASAAILAARRTDVEMVRDAADLSGLRERKERADGAVERGRAARARLDAIRLDDALYASIEAAHVEVEKAAALRAAGAPTLTLRALASIEPVVDGKTARLAAGASLERSVSGSLTVGLPGVAEIRVDAGSSVDELTAVLDDARRHEAALCSQAGVADRSAAAMALAERRGAQAELDEAARTVRDARGDLTLEALSQQIATLAERLARLTDSRPAEPPPAATADEARTLLDAAESDDRDAAAAVDAAQAAAEVARSTVEDRRRAAAERGAYLTAATEAEARATGALAAARAALGDAEIEGNLAEAARAEERARADGAAAASALDAALPAAVDLLAANARRALADAEARVHGLETELAEVRAGLRARGEEGLKERLEETEGKVDRAEAALRSVARRAAAARLLFGTLVTARDEARRRYAGPLRSRIVEMGRVVFGPDFSVELGDDLTIETRTLERVTVDWAALSGGAKEQLAVLVRLAAASIVSDAGGVPVILDDILGYSDPARLRAMGALLSEAGRTGQIIVLTCFPERYAHVGGAHRERLG